MTTAEHNLNMHGGLPRPLLDETRGEVVALLLDSNTAILGCWSSPESPGGAVDLFHPVMVSIDRYGSPQPSSPNLLRRLLNKNTACQRFYQYAALIYQCDLDSSVFDTYIELREQIWGI